MSSSVGSVEAQRIIGILEDATEKIAFLDSITPDVYQHRDELSRFIGDEISRSMSEQRMLERRYEQLIEARASLKGLVNKTKYKLVQEEIQDVSRGLRESTNSLSRSLKENPNVSGNLIKIQRDRMELVDLLHRSIQELKDKGTFAALVQRVDDELHAQKRLHQLRTREEQLKSAVERLERELTEEKHMYQRTVAEQRATISQLKDELARIKTSTSVDSKYKRHESSAKTSAIWRGYKQSERVQQERIEELEQKLVMENVVHTRSREFLEDKYKRLGEELKQWEEKSVDDVNEKDREISQLSTQRTELLTKLTALRLRKQKELEDAERAKEYEERAAIAKKAEAALLRKRNRAAATIQRCMRNYLRHQKELEALKPAKKKGKGKGKGKGKK